MFEFGVLFFGLLRRKRLAMTTKTAQELNCSTGLRRRKRLAMTEKNAGILLAVRKW
jgi:hypothetical protein